MRPLKQSEIHIPFFFLAISILWIIFSDRFFLYFSKNHASVQIKNIQTFKGCFFVFAVALFVYLLMKSSAKEIVRSRAAYKELFYNMPVPIIFYDVKTKKISNVNRAALETYGYSQDELLEMSIEDLRMKVNEDDSKANIYKYQKKNGEVIICQETTSEITLNNESGRLVSVYDISELENAKAELIQRENQLKSVLNSITDGFFILNYDLTIEKANEVFKSMAEIPVDKVEGQKLFHLLPSIKVKFFYKEYSSELQKNETLYFETFYEKTNSWYRVSAYPFDGGRFSVFFRDITRQKEDELKIYENEQNLSALINNTDDLIWSIDCNYRYFTFNESFRKWYKHYFNGDVWIGKLAFYQQGRTPIDDKWQGLYQRALKGEKFSVEMNFEVDGKLHFTKVRFNPIYNSDKKIFAAGCFLQNITESKLHERMIQQQNLQLREIAFMTSHEVRVPVANILGLTEILDSENPLSPSNCKVIEYIKISAQELDIKIRKMVKETATIND